MTLEENREHRVIAWVGGLPDRWEVHSLGSQLVENRSSNKGMIESRVLSLSYGNVIVKPEEKLRGLVPESFETYQIVEPGDIVIRPTDLQNDQTSLRVGQSRYRGIITSAYICLRPTASLNHRYAALLLSGYDHMKVFYGFGSGLRQNLDVKHIKHIPVPVPSHEEQELIVRYLDHAELRIAKAIAAKLEVLRLLEESRSVVAWEELIGGSGDFVQAGWMGSVPTSYKRVRLKSVLREVVERSGTGNQVLLSLRMREGLVHSSEYRTAAPQAADLSNYKVVRTGQLVMNRMRASIGLFGVADEDGIVSPDYAVFEPCGPVHLPFLLALLKTPQMGSLIRSASRGMGTGSAGFLRIYTDSFGVLPVWLPSFEEQVTRQESLSYRVSDIDKAIRSVSKEIALLKEYRTRLISDVVTGKLDVRAEAAKLPAIDPDELVEVTAGAGLTAEDGGDDE